MYKFSYSDELGVLFLKHYDEFVGAEAARAIVAVNETLLKQQKIRFNEVCLDLREVTKSTLNDSDRSFAIMTLNSLVNRDLRIATIITSSNPATANLLERIRRVSPVYKITNFESDS
jgi:hypothetical protein